VPFRRAAATSSQSTWAVPRHSESPRPARTIRRGAAQSTAEGRQNTAGAQAWPGSVFLWARHRDRCVSPMCVAVHRRCKSRNHGRTAIASRAAGVFGHVRWTVPESRRRSSASAPGALDPHRVDGGEGRRAASAPARRNPPGRATNSGLASNPPPPIHVMRDGVRSPNRRRRPAEGRRPATELGFAYPRSGVPRSRNRGELSMPVGEGRCRESIHSPRRQLREADFGGGPSTCPAPHAGRREIARRNDSINRRLACHRRRWVFAGVERNVENLAPQAILFVGAKRAVEHRPIRWWNASAAGRGEAWDLLRGSARLPGQRSAGPRRCPGGAGAHEQSVDSAFGGAVGEGGSMPPHPSSPAVCAHRASTCCGRCPRGGSGDPNRASPGNGKVALEASPAPRPARRQRGRWPPRMQSTPSAAPVCERSLDCVRCCTHHFEVARRPARGADALETNPLEPVARGTPDVLEADCDGRPSSLTESTSSSGVVDRAIVGGSALKMKSIGSSGRRAGPGAPVGRPECWHTNMPFGESQLAGGGCPQGRAGRVPGRSGLEVPGLRGE